MTGARPATVSVRAFAVLAYLGWWVTGVLVLLFGPRERTVRFHAAQSTIVFGLTLMLWAACWLGSFAALTISAGAFAALQRAAIVIQVAALVLWIACLWSAWSGRVWQVPLAGRWAARWADRP